MRTHTANKCSGNAHTANQLNSRQINRKKMYVCVHTGDRERQSTAHSVQTEGGRQHAGHMRVETKNKKQKQKQMKKLKERKQLRRARVHIQVRGEIECAQTPQAADRQGEADKQAGQIFGKSEFKKKL